MVVYGPLIAPVTWLASPTLGVPDDGRADFAAHSARDDVTDHGSLDANSMPARGLLVQHNSIYYGTQEKGYDPISSITRTHLCFYGPCCAINSIRIQQRHTPDGQYGADGQQQIPGSHADYVEQIPDERRKRRTRQLHGSKDIPERPPFPLGWGEITDEGVASGIYAVHARPEDEDNEDEDDRMNREDGECDHTKRRRGHTDDQ